MISIAVLGYGTVGSGVVEVLEKNKDVINQRAGDEISVKYVLDLRDFPGDPIQEKIVHDIDVIINDPEVQIVVEVMGGVEPAYTFVKRCLEAGKSVATSNKALVAKHGATLLSIAREREINFLFEASVGGGIPIIRALNSSLTADRIEEITGILNGTTNYILTKMFEENMSFEAALAKATELGYAEADPTADVEGLDAGRKAAILSSIAFHSRVQFKDVYTEGITKITAEDIAYAKEFDCVIKLLAVAHNTDKGIEVGVYPVLLGKEHPLSSVRDSFNAVFVHGDAVDDAMFYGRGAGEMPTASAVVGDVIDVARNLQFGCNGRISCTCYQDLPVKPFDEVKNKFFLRMQVKNEPGVLAKVASVFGGHKVSIRRVVQKHVQEEAAELVISTEKVKEYHIKDALRELQKMDSISEISSMIREY